MSFTAFILCVADPSWSLYSWFLICYHLPCYYFRPVSFMLPFNTCISPDHLVYYHLTTCHATIWQDPLVMLWLALTIINLLPWLTRLLSILWYAWLFTKYHHPVMLSLDTQHDILDLWLSPTGILPYYPVSWSVTCFPALHAVTWLYSTYVLLNSWSCLFPVFPVKW